VTDEIAAVLWDFGGVILSSPFDAFNDYEVSAGLPRDLIRTINSTNPDTNAWARLERGEVGHHDFCRLFEAEAAARGFSVDADRIMGMLHGHVRDDMVEALRRVIAAGYRTALLTNNFVRTVSPDGASARDLQVRAIVGLFDAVIESSVAGVRKPDPRFYERACEALDVAPSQCVFLDDLGINLKPAAAMGMRTIKVVSSSQAITDLEAILGLTLR
jgi:putative hydrolase of the HAD superfamily